MPSALGIHVKYFQGLILQYNLQTGVCWNVSHLRQERGHLLIHIKIVLFQNASVISSVVIARVSPGPGE